MSDVYQVNFSKWTDVQKDYKMQEPEPEEVLLAYYSYEDYSGSSYVFYRNGDKYYYNHGGHCSCYGLEGQWEPEEYENKEIFKTCLEKMYSKYDNELNDNLKIVIEKLG